MNANRKLVTAAAALGLLLAGGAIGAVVAAPTATDIRNACVADSVVPRAGLPTGLTPGPRVPTTTPWVQPKSLDEQPIEEQP